MAAILPWASEAGVVLVLVWAGLGEVQALPWVGGSDDVGCPHKHTIGQARLTLHLPCS